MKTIAAKMDVVDVQTGETTETRAVEWKLMPPQPGACPVCARFPSHEADQPHNASSLYYQYAFYSEHGRWPTWRDAVAHCPPDVQAAWEAELRRRGLWPDEVSA